MTLAISPTLPLNIINGILVACHFSTSLACSQQQRQRAGSAQHSVSGAWVKPHHQPRVEEQNTLCRASVSQGLIFVGSSLASEWGEWKNEAGLKQIAASGETCGLRLNRAINQRTDMEGGREGESGRQEERGTQRNPKMRQQQRTIKHIEPHPRTDYYCVIFFPLFFSVISVKVDKEQPPR